MQGARLQTDVFTQQLSCAALRRDEGENRL
jgi:hypothetical protein